MGVGLAVTSAICGKLVRRRGRNKTTSLHAVVEDDSRVAVVRRWVDEFVVRKKFCPWAMPADDDKHIRLVSSSATSEDGVLEDLAAEAKKLLETADEPAPGEVTTTLVVCPHVKAWDDYESFRLFFAEELQNGYALSDELGLKVVAFHPAYERYDPELNDGDEIALAGPDGITVVGTLLDADAGVDEDDGQQLVEVRLDDGDEFLVGKSTIIRVIKSSHSSGDAGSKTEQTVTASEDPSSLVMRAPRPVLHLLREYDLDRAGEVEGVEEAVMSRNRKRIVEMGGAKSIADLLQSCETE